MICTTVKPGTECGFMTKAGCGYTGGACSPIVEQCEGCQRVMEVAIGRYCTSYPNPMVKWKTNHCNFATHAKLEAAAQSPGKVNPLKASKRATKKK